MSVAKSLIKGAEEALAIAKGEMEPAAVFIPETIDVAAIRKKQNLSQAAFANRFGLSVGTVRDWEQARRSPDRAALILLSVIDREPDAVVRTLSGA
jgi:putative transcriptional regulator